MIDTLLFSPAGAPSEENAGDFEAAAGGTTPPLPSSTPLPTPPSTPPLPGSTPPLPGTSESVAAAGVERLLEAAAASECGRCEIESDEHVIVCVEAGGGRAAEEEEEQEEEEEEEEEQQEEQGEVEDEAAAAALETTEADAAASEAEEVEEDEEALASPSSPCMQVLDGHFEALTALASEGRTTAPLRRHFLNLGFSHRLSRKRGPVQTFVSSVRKREM